MGMLNVPIFTGFSTRSKVRQADVDLGSLEKRLNRHWLIRSDYTEMQEHK
jgi:hypothetical protein